jgi:2'-5' RNA ligase
VASQSSEAHARKARPGSPRARLFVALDLPAGARAELVEWRSRVFAGRSDVRLLDPAALHVTLVFLGYRPEKEIATIGELVRSAAAGLPAPVLSATAVKPLPPRRPRLFALDLEDPGGRAVALQEAVSDALERARAYKPEKRPFWPHVTLARVKSRERQPAPLGAVSPPPAGEWRADAVTLYRSVLRPQGALYEPLARSMFAD